MNDGVDEEFMVEVVLSGAELVTSWNREVGSKSNRVLGVAVTSAPGMCGTLLKLGRLLVPEIGGAAAEVEGGCCLGGSCRGRLGRQTGRSALLSGLELLGSHGTLPAVFERLNVPIFGAVWSDGSVSHMALLASR